MVSVLNSTPSLSLVNSSSPDCKQNWRVSWNDCSLIPSEYVVIHITHIYYLRIWTSGCFPSSKFKDHLEPAFSLVLNEDTQVSPCRPHILQPPLLGRPWLEKPLSAISMSLKFFFPCNHQNNICHCEKYIRYRKIEEAEKPPLIFLPKENSYFTILPSNLFFYILCSLHALICKCIFAFWFTDI